MFEFLFKWFQSTPKHSTGVHQEEVQMKLTKRQQKLLDYLKLHMDDSGRVGKTAAQAARDIPMHASAVSLVLDELCDMSLVRREGAGKYRRELWVNV